MAEVISSICCLKPASSCVTGLRASSASFALFSRAFLSTSQADRSASKSFFIFLVFGQVQHQLILGLGGFCLLGFQICSKISNLRDLLIYFTLQQYESMSISLLKSQAYNQLYTWHLGANADCFFPADYLKSQGSIQVLILALGG